MGDTFGITNNEYKVINIKYEYENIVTYFPRIDIRVRVTSREAKVKKDLVHFFIPSTRCFLEAIEGFIEV